MKKLYTIFATLLLSSFAISQSSVEFIGVDDQINYASDTVYVSGDGDEVGFIYKEFTVKNTGTTTEFYWARSIISKSSSDMQVQLCDETTCYPTGDAPFWIIEDQFKKTILPGASAVFKPQLTFGLSSGSAKVKYYALDGDKNKIDSVTVFFTSTLSTKKEEKLEFNIFPNPAQSVVTFKGEAIKNGGTVVFLDALGKEVKRASVTASNNQVNVSALRRGVYFVNVYDQSGTKSTVQRLIKQ